MPVTKCFSRRAFLGGLAVAPAVPLLPMATGDLRGSVHLGMLGEQPVELILPLKRGPDGRLGVDDAE